MSENVSTDKAKETSDSIGKLTCTIGSLFGKRFYIPDYQRGYRWGEKETRTLLDDIIEFIMKKPSSEEIYCIQPLVTNYIKTENHYRVIDGQQRLTTIYLILLYLASVKALDEKNSDLFSIEYETRKDSEGYLKNPIDKLRNDNIDYYHINRVSKYIKYWFNEKKNDLKLKEFVDVLLNKVCFIDYKLNEDDKEAEVFARINKGKIPLTDAELIKALLLNKSNGSTDDELLRIATQWDMVEITLQNDEFWYFIGHNDYSKPTRIDYILDLISTFDDLKTEKHFDSTFSYFAHALKNVKSNLKDEKSNTLIWNEIYVYFEIFKEWYQDYQLYHYIGYLVTITKDNINKYDPNILLHDLVKDWKYMDKKGFVDLIKLRITAMLFHLHGWINPKTGNWWDTDFEFKKGDSAIDENGHKVTISENCPPKSEVRDVLLLHNVETIVRQNEKLVSDKKKLYNLPNFSKFPFHLYKKEAKQWEIEHIRPNSGDKLEDEADQRLYLFIAKDYVGGDKDLIKAIDNFINGNSGKYKFEDLLKSLEVICASNQLSDRKKNRIYNYTLLDKTTNTEYGNQIFPVKRDFIINKERGFKLEYDKNNLNRNPLKIREVAFILPCTKNVFTKFYTKKPANLLYWSDDDANDYLTDMKDKLEPFIDANLKKRIDTVNIERKNSSLNELLPKRISGND